MSLGIFREYSESRTTAADGEERVAEAPEDVGGAEGGEGVEASAGPCGTFLEVHAVVKRIRENHSEISTAEDCREERRFVTEDVNYASFFSYLHDGLNNVIVKDTLNEHSN